MKIPRSRRGAALLAALLAGAAVWLSGAERPRLYAFSLGELPRGQQDQRSGLLVFSNGDPLNPIPREPMAVAVAPGGDVLVADAGLGRVHRYSRGARLLRTYPEDSVESPLRYPVGVAAHDRESVAWVSDLWGRRLYRLDLGSGSLVGFADDALGDVAPGALAFRQGRLYVADVSQHRVLVFDEAGALLRTIGGGRGAGPGQFAYPNGIWVTDAGDVYVTDSNNARIQVFDGLGRLQRILQPHRLGLPRGLVQDRTGRLHVADTMGHDIALLDASGQIVRRYTLGEELTAPNGLAVDGRVLYVADRGNARVLAWQMEDDGG